MKKLDESSVLWLKKWAGTLTEGESQDEYMKRINASLHRDYSEEQVKQIIDIIKKWAHESIYGPNDREFDDCDDGECYLVLGEGSDLQVIYYDYGGPGEVKGQSNMASASLGFGVGKINEDNDIVIFVDGTYKIELGSEGDHYTHVNNSGKITSIRAQTGSRYSATNKIIEGIRAIGGKLLEASENQAIAFKYTNAPQNYRDQSYYDGPESDGPDYGPDRPTWPKE